MQSRQSTHNAKRDGEDWSSSKRSLGLESGDLTQSVTHRLPGPLLSTNLSCGGKYRS